MRSTTVSAVCAAVLLLLLGASCTVSVQHGLEEPAADDVVTALERAGIGAEKRKDEGGAAFVVDVARGDGTRALELLRALGLPRGRRRGFSETYGQPSLVPSATEERARYVEALGNEIERTLETIEGVVSARAHIVLPESDPFAPEGKTRVEAQAAILLKTRGSGAVVKENDVQRLVAGSVPGLAPAAVAVVVTQASELTTAGPPAMAPLGPLRVAPGSKPVLVTATALALVLIAALAGAVLLLSRKLAAANRARL